MSINVKISDQELCNQVVQGDKGAFKALQKKYERLFFVISKETFEAGTSDIHEQMAINYNQLIEDVSQIVWSHIYKSINKGISFENQYAFVNLLRTITQRKTLDLKNKSLLNRTQSSIIGHSNTFHRIDDTDSSDIADEFDITELTKSESETETDKLFHDLLNILNSKEKFVFELMQRKSEQSDKVDKLTQEKMAEILGITTRTIRTRIKSIREKATKIKSLSTT